MTDQDPTQAYAPPAAVPPAPSAPEPAAPVPPAPPAPPATADPAPGAAYQPPAAPAYEATSPYQPAAAAPVAPPAPGYESTPASQPAPSADPVPTAPVSMDVGARRPGRSPLRWIVALVAVLLVAGTAAGATLLLTSKAGDPAVLAWAPADAVMYGEARLDLPGNQGAELAKLMKAFPGFEDQAAFPAKLAELLDQAAGKATDGKVSWKNDIEPWFGGQLAFTLGRFPSASDPSSMRAGLLASVKDAAKASAWLAKVAAEANGTTSTQDYNGTTITLVKDDATSMAKVDAGYAVVGPVLVAGDLQTIKDVIDTKGTAGLPTNAQFKEANAAATGDRLGFAYLDYRTLFDQLQALMPAGTATQLPKALTDQLPTWIVETFRAQDAAFVMDSRAPHSDMNGAAAESRIPGLVPAGTVALMDGHDLGATLKKMHDLYGQVDEYKDALKQVDDALAVLGGFDAVTSWMGESAVAITKSGDSITGGIVVVPTDRAAADRLFTQLKGFIQLGGAQAGLKVSEEDYKGTPITVVDLSGLSGLAGQMGGGVSLPADLKLSYVVTDEVVALGYGTDFVKAVLDTRAGGASLAADARFKDATARLGAKSAGLWWVDIAAVRTIAEGLLPADEKATYEKDVKPYLDALDYLVLGSVPGTPYDAGTFVLKVAGN